MTRVQNAGRIRYLLIADSTFQRMDEF